MTTGRRLPLAVALAALTWAFGGRSPVRAISAGVMADGQAAVTLGSAHPGQETPVARLQFNPLSVPWPWELRMQPQSDALQGPSGSVPLDRLQWSVSVGPDYAVAPRQPLAPGVTVVHRQDQPGYPLVVHWWFRPTWADPASSQPYRLGILYTATTDPENPVSPAVLYPNPYDPARGPLHVLVRWGGLPDDAQWSGRPVWLQVASLSGPRPPPCGDPGAADVFEGPRQTLPVSDPNDPAWVRYPWFEMTWDGRNRDGQTVAPGRYCVAVVMQVGIYGDFTVASGAVDVLPGAPQGVPLAVSVVSRRSGVALPGAWVRIGRGAGAAGREGRTGPDGRVRFVDLPAGRYVVAARAPGYREAAAEVALSASRPQPVEVVTLRLEPVEAPRLALRALPPAGQAAVLGDLVRVELSATAPPSTPLGSGEVVVELPEGLAGLPGTLRGSRPQDGARLEAGGRRVVWSVGALPAGAAAELTFVSAVTPGAAGARRLTLAASGAFALSPAAGLGAGGSRHVEAEPAVAELALAQAPEPAASVVVGRVVDGRGEGIEGARIRAEDGTATRSGPQGWFTLALAPGPHLLAAYPAGPAEGESLGPAARARVDVGHPAVHPVVLQLASPSGPSHPGAAVAAVAAVAASGSARWEAGVVDARGGLEASVHWGGADARVNVQAGDGSLRVTGARAAAAGHVLAVGASQEEAAELVRRFYPTRPSGLVEGASAMRGPLSVWSWAGGRHPHLAAGVALAPEGSRSPAADGSHRAETVRGLAGVRLDLAAGGWWARAHLLEAGSARGRRPRRLLWETGLTRWTDAYTLEVSGAADQAEGPGGSVEATGQGLELKLATPGERGGYGLGWRKREGSFAAAALRRELDPLGALAGAVGSPERAGALEEFTLRTGLLGWGLRRLTGYRQELADTFAHLTLLHPGAVARRAGPGAEGASGGAEGRPQPSLSIDGLGGEAGAGGPASGSEAALVQLRAGVVSASALEEDEGASWWRPYLSADAAWPLAVGPALRRARVGGSLLWLPEGADPAGPREGVVRGGAWADLAGEPIAGLQVGVRARWEPPIRPGPGAERAGLVLHAELHPKGPVSLGAGARSTASGLRWDELTVAYRQRPVQVELRASPAELRITAAIHPPTPWHARLSGRWDATVTLQELQARAAYLGDRWWATADVHGSSHARTIEAAVGRRTPGWPGRAGRAAGGEPASETGGVFGPGAGLLAGVAPSARLVWKRAWAGGLELDTVVVEPAVRIPLGDRWGLLVEGASAFQWSATAGWQARPAAWGGAGVYARAGGEAGALVLEMGYRWAGPDTPLAWGSSGLFVRVGSWGLGRWEHPVPAPGGSQR